ncbi:MAG: hypothetical protein JWP76_350 [Dactylosporangium sp.]|jgi:hypothetical protein|nr:hypothetical protein [Dactylosporangium sp.]
MRSIHSGVWRPEDRAESRYRYLPVDVPPGARSLGVSLAYDAGQGVLDLGCLDPDGQFRGWSGGARSEFTITQRWATPGYLPGPVTPGSWRVVLGLHRVPPEGVSWTVTGEAALAVPDAPEVGAVATPARPPSRNLPAPPGLTWLAGDLHSHTVHSDGALTVAQLAVLAAGNGLDFLAVTDHNTVSHHGELTAAGEAGGLVLVPGQEITTDRGHANAYGDIGWVDFRRPANEWLSAVDARGGLLSVNHPLGGDLAWLHPLDERPPLAEVWHSGWWDRTWGAPLAWLLAWGADTVPVGGSDFHSLVQPERPGHPTTWVACEERTVDGVLAGLATGLVAITESPTGPALLHIGDELIAVDADGTLLVDFTGRRRPVRGDRVAFAAGSGPHWLEDHRAQVLALSA